jgi:hypothetical protein
MGGGRMKENGGGGQFKYDIFYIITFVNTTMYPYPTQKNPCTFNENNYKNNIMFMKKMRCSIHIMADLLLPLTHYKGSSSFFCSTIFFALLLC